MLDLIPTSLWIMRMNITPFAICLTCCENIKEFGEDALKLCLDTCGAHCNCEILSFDQIKNKKMSDDSDLLEDYGYVVSCEISKTEIALKPICAQILCEEYANVYCWCEYGK